MRVYFGVNTWFKALSRQFLGNCFLSLLKELTQNIVSLFLPVTRTICHSSFQETVMKLLQKIRTHRHINYS